MTCSGARPHTQLSLAMNPWSHLGDLPRYCTSAGRRDGVQLTTLKPHSPSGRIDPNANTLTLTFTLMLTLRSPPDRATNPTTSTRRTGSIEAESPPRAHPRSSGASDRNKQPVHRFHAPCASSSSPRRSRPFLASAAPSRTVRSTGNVTLGHVGCTSFITDPDSRDIGACVCFRVARYSTVRTVQYRTQSIL
jgi:hypothetical protein